MRKPQISIRFLMLVVVIVGLAFAALANPSELWASSMFSLTIAILLYSLLATAFGRGQRRVQTAGFALFGWSYLIYIVAMDEFDLPTSLSKKSIISLWNWLNPRVDQINLGEPVRILSFAQIGYCLFTLFVALLGSLVVRVFAVKEDDAPPSS